MHGEEIAADSWQGAAAGEARGIPIAFRACGEVRPLLAAERLAEPPTILDANIARQKLGEMGPEPRAAG